MFSLHDITSVCPKVEVVSDEGEFDVDDDQTDRMSEEFPLDESNIHVKASEYTTTKNDDPMNDLDDNISTSPSGDTVSDKSAATKSSPDNTSMSLQMSRGQFVKAYTMAPVVYEGGGHEAVYCPAPTAESKLEARKFGQENYIYDMKSRKILQRYGAHEELPDSQSSIYRTMPYGPMVSKRELSPYQGLDAYSGTHRSLTPYEMDIPRKPCCNCPCHIPSSSYALAPEVKSQRPSVIMVPAKRSDAFSDISSKVDAVTRRLISENSNLWQNVQQNRIHELGDLDSSDDDEDGGQEKYFRVNLDGTTARFKLTKEDWERIPINTFPSGGRLLSGDWTRIFLSKVKESNPWCSLRFKNNHVRSENSRKIHSAVFFRGGAECKRPECNVKVRFVIRKEKGKHVDVTYVGNVCHSRNPGGGDALNGRKRRQVRCARAPSDLHG